MRTQLDPVQLGDMLFQRTPAIAELLDFDRQLSLKNILPICNLTFRQYPLLGREGVVTQDARAKKAEVK